MRCRWPPAPYPCGLRAGGRAAGDRGHADARGAAPQRRRARRGEPRRGRADSRPASSDRNGGRGGATGGGDGTGRPSCGIVGLRRGTRTGRRGSRGGGCETAMARRETLMVRRGTLRAAGGCPRRGRRITTRLQTHAPRHAPALECADHRPEVHAPVDIDTRGPGVMPRLDVGLMACGGSCAPRRRSYSESTAASASRSSARTQPPVHAGASRARAWRVVTTQPEAPCEE